MARLEGGAQKPPSAPSLASATRAACAWQQTSREKCRVTECAPHHYLGTCTARLPCIRALLWTAAFLASVPGTHLPLAQLQLLLVSCCVALHACMHACTLLHWHAVWAVNVTLGVPLQAVAPTYPAPPLPPLVVFPRLLGPCKGATRCTWGDHAALPMQAIQKMNVHAKQPEATNSCLFANFGCPVQVTLAPAGSGPFQTVAWGATPLTLPGTPWLYLAVAQQLPQGSSNSSSNNGSSHGGNEGTRGSLGACFVHLLDSPYPCIQHTAFYIAC